MLDDKINECIWLEASLNQLEIMTKDQALQTKYYDLGCYNCDGYKKDCSNYQKKYRRKEGNGTINGDI